MYSDNGFDDFDLGPQSDEYDYHTENEYDDSFADNMEEPFDRGPMDDQEALDSVYGPSDEGQYDYEW